LGYVGFRPSAVIYGLLGDVVTSQTLLLFNEIRVAKTCSRKKTLKNEREKKRKVMLQVEYQAVL
jgi:hypothetical protein